MSVIGTFKDAGGIVYMGADGICTDACHVRTVASNPKVIKKMIGPSDSLKPMMIGCCGSYRILNVVQSLKLPWSQVRTPYHYVSGILVPRLRERLAESEAWSVQDGFKEWTLTVIWGGRVFEINHTTFEVMEPAVPYTANGAAMEIMIGSLATQHRMGVHPESAIIEGLHVCDLHHVYASPPFYVYAIDPDSPDVDCLIYGAKDVGMSPNELRLFWDD